MQIVSFLIENHKGFSNYQAISLSTTAVQSHVRQGAPLFAAAFGPLLIERAHHSAGFGLWDERLPFETLALHGQPPVLPGVVVALAALPAGRLRFLDR